MIAVIFEVEPHTEQAHRYFELAAELRESLTAQQEGRAQVFSSYRLRVAQVLRDYGLNHRKQAPADAVG